jgi:hypothetical protein
VGSRGGGRVQAFLEQARQFRRHRHEGRELIEGQHSAGRGLVPDPGKQGIPVGISDPIEPGVEAGELGRQGRPLEGTRPIVGHVVDRVAGRQGLQEQAGLSAPAAPVQDAEAPPPPGDEPSQPPQFLTPIQERQSHGIPP